MSAAGNRAAVSLLAGKGESSSNGEPGSVLPNIVARSPAMTRVISLVRKAAPTDCSVLIVGETGTGKELIARAIHRLSRRNDADFVPVDCVALPFHLLESELFGFEKGAFTGAFNRKHGLLEFAHHGTLFLDEIANLEMSLQAKLLRVLQERQFRRLGGHKLIEVDIRVIAAMNEKPRSVLAEGRLRKDLFYRLNVVPIHLPPLRQRCQDIPLLVAHFLESAIERNHLPPVGISQSALEKLMAYRWPGNVRQLENVIERLASLSADSWIDVQHLPAYIRTSKTKASSSIFDMPFNQAKHRYLEMFERKYFRKLLMESKNDIAKAAQIAGISGRTVYRKMKRYGRSMLKTQQSGR